MLVCPDYSEWTQEHYVSVFLYLLEVFVQRLNGYDCAQTLLIHHCLSLSDGLSPVLLDIFNNEPEENKGAVY
jgi:hypothetical protein